MHPVEDYLVPCEIDHAGGLEGNGKLRSFRASTLAIRFFL